ncbi:MAG: hypothetical protein ACTSQE_14505 [Candidatus Heimdallarchaeaceae archaeon]
MSTTSVKIDKEIYRDLQAFAYKKHKSFKCAKTELEEAVKQYLAEQQD